MYDSFIKRSPSKQEPQRSQSFWIMMILTLILTITAKIMVIMIMIKTNHDDDANITCYYKQVVQRASREPISSPTSAPRDLP